MHCKKILFFLLLFLTHAVHPMKQRRALSKGFFARNAQSSLFLHQKNTHGPIASRIYSSTQKGYLSRMHFSRNLEHTHSLPIIIGIGLGYGLSSAKTGNIQAEDVNKTNEIGIKELFDRVRDNTLEFCLIESNDKEKYQMAILKHYLNIICKTGCGLENYKKKENFLKILISSLKKIKNQKSPFVESLSKSLIESCLSDKGLYYDFQNLIKTMIKYHPTYSEDILIDYFENTTLAAICNKVPVSLILKAIKHIPSIATIMKDHLIRNFLSPQEDIPWERYITACIKTNPEFAQEFAIKLANFIEETQSIENLIKRENFLTIFQTINSIAPCNKEIENALQRKRLNSTTFFDATLLQELLYSNSCTSSCIVDTIPKTSTINHLKEHTHKGHPEVLGAFVLDEDLSILAHDVIKKEEELQKTHYTFIHAQCNNYLLAEQLHTFFELNKHKKPFKNTQFLNLRVKKHSDDLEDAKKYHEQLIKDGCKGTAEEKSVLFMNKSLFGNISKLGECSAEYITSNRNVSFIKLKLKDIFKIHGHSDLYNKYKTRLRALHQEHMKELPNLGTTILIAIPKVAVNKYIFSAHPYGRKKKITIKDHAKKLYFFKKLKSYKTDNVSNILQTLEKEPEKIKKSDRLIFCLPMTIYSGLNPESGIKMYPFTAGNSSQLDAWYTQLYNLFDEIEADIRKKNETLH